MNQTGYIKLYRSLSEQPWYNDSEAVHLFVHLLISATYTERDHIYKGKLTVLKPGQLVTGRRRLSRETGISESKIQRLLKMFENCHQIEQQTNSANRCISIVCWDKYQQSEQQMNSSRTANEQQMNSERTHNKKERKKEGKEGKKESAAAIPGTEQFELLKKIGKDAARMWIEGGVAATLPGSDHILLALQWMTYRAGIGKPIRSQQELTSIIERFSSHSTTDLEKIIRYSIDNQYPGLYFDRLAKGAPKKANGNRYNLDPNDLEKMRQQATTTPSGLKIL